MTITEIYIKYTHFKLYIFYTFHNILSSHYSLQSLELVNVFITSDSARHISHYISRAPQLEELVLGRVRGRYDERYVHN